MIINCPDCRRKYETEIENGSIDCNKCLQKIIIKEGIATHCIPKDLYKK